VAHKRLESLRELVILQDKMGRFFERGQDATPSVGGVWIPSIDLYENNDQIILMAELPGVAQNEVRIELSGNFITIQGQRCFKGGKEKYLCIERSYGPFQRTFRLPAVVEENSVAAEFRLGVLKITMKKDKGQNPEYVRVKIK